MLRLHPERDPEKFPSVYHPKHAEPTDPLYCVGKELSTEVYQASSKSGCRC
jgi:hypothetical protein